MSINSQKSVRKFERKQKLDTIMIKLYAFQRKKGLELMINNYREKEKGGNQSPSEIIHKASSSSMPFPKR